VWRAKKLKAEGIKRSRWGLISQIEGQETQKQVVLSIGMFGSRNVVNQNWQKIPLFFVAQMKSFTFFQMPILLPLWLMHFISFSLIFLKPYLYSHATIDNGLLLERYVSERQFNQAYRGTQPVSSAYQTASKITKKRRWNFFFLTLLNQLVQALRTQVWNNWNFLYESSFCSIE